jgi:hypothetical protein
LAGHEHSRRYNGPRHLRETDGRKKWRGTRRREIDAAASIETSQRCLYDRSAKPKTAMRRKYNNGPQQVIASAPFEAGIADNLIATRNSFKEGAASIFDIIGRKICGLQRFAETGVATGHFA